MPLPRSWRPAVIWAVGLLASLACGDDGEQQEVAHTSANDSTSGGAGKRDSETGDAAAASNPEDLADDLPDTEDSGTEDREPDPNDDGVGGGPTHDEGGGTEGDGSADPVSDDDQSAATDDSGVPDRVPPPEPTKDGLWVNRDLALEVRFIDVVSDAVYWVEHSGLGWVSNVDGDPDDAQMLVGPILTVPETDRLGLLHVELAPPLDDASGKLYYSTGGRLVERGLDQDEFDSWEPGIFAGDVAIAHPYLYVTNKCIDVRRTSVFPEARGQPTYERQWSVEFGTEIRCGADNSCSWGALWVNEAGGLCAGADGIRGFDQELSEVAMLVQTSREPVALCVFGDQMYWLEGVQGRVSQDPSAEAEVTVHKAALDGTSAELVATGKVGYVGQYRCDADRRQILWVNNSDAAFRGNAGAASIEVFDLDEKTTDSVVVADLAIRALAVHERYLFWSEQASLKRIER